jgi:hypothetical protein
LKLRRWDRNTLLCARDRSHPSPKILLVHPDSGFLFQIVQQRLYLFALQILFDTRRHLSKLLRSRLTS